MQYGRKQVNEDMAYILEGRHGGETDDTDADEQTAVKMVRAALAESEPHFVEEPSAGVLWTHLYGRLFHYRKNAFVNTFLDDMIAFAPAPWYRSEGAFPAPEPSTGKVVSVSEREVVTLQWGQCRGCEIR